MKGHTGVAALASSVPSQLLNEIRCGDSRVSQLGTRPPPSPEKQARVERHTGETDLLNSDPRASARSAKRASLSEVRGATQQLRLPSAAHLRRRASGSVW